METSLPVICPMAGPAPSLALRPTWSSSPGLIKSGHGEGAELQTLVRRSWGSATSSMALVAAMQSLGPTGKGNPGSESLD